MILFPDDPHQIYFTSRSELVSGEELVHTIDEVVNQLDLTSLYECWSEQGRGFYDPAMMLKILFLAYCDSQRHSRDIAQKIKYDVRYQYFAGSHRPTYRTICRFRVINVELLAGYFAQIVSICERIGALNTSLIAIDGTKVRASASRRKAFRKSDLDSLTLRYEKLLAADASADSVDNVDGPEEDANVAPVNRVALKDRIAKALTQLKSGATEVNLTDGDARLMKDSQGRFQPSYNGQIAADKNQMIVAVGLGNNSDDTSSFRPMVEQSQVNVAGAIGAVLVDGGYYSKRNLQYAIEEGFDLYMPMGKGCPISPQKFTRDDFVYDTESDSYVCPSGQRLTFKTRRLRGGVESRLYRCSESACSVCALCSQCTTAPARELNISAVWRHEQAMKTKLRSPAGRAVYDFRKILVEPVFGNMKFNLGFGRFVLRGLNKVRGEFLLMCIAHNLRKLSLLHSGGGPISRLETAVVTRIQALLQQFGSLKRTSSWFHVFQTKKLEYAL